MTRDVVIVGGGIAGLSAAWRLRHRDVLLLEAGDRLGGRMRSDPCGDYWLNYGAHLFPAPGSLVDGMARECGLETVPVTGSMMGLAVGDTMLERRARRDLSVPAAALACATGSRSRAPGVKVQRAVARYHRAGRTATTSRTTARSPSSSARCRPPSHDIFSCAAHRATAELDELSAGCGDRAVRARVGRQGLADRAQPARRDRPAAGGARPRARRARPHGLAASTRSARRRRARRSAPPARRSARGT